MQVKPCYKWLLTLALLAVGHGVALKYRDLASETCATLRNHETYSSVEVSVGNPPQSFSLIADTGSDAVIVKDCACGNCRPEWGRTCFSGPQHSSSFNVTFFEAPNVRRSQKKKHEELFFISFGSGAVATRVASDEVRLGAVKTYMENGLLLVVRQDLDIHDRFEGILGLGRPKFFEDRPDIPQDEMFGVPNFFEQAGVRRFSLCFNHQTDGVLGINTKPHVNPLTSVGQMHWGLDFHGISVGEEKQKLNFCNPNSKKAGMQTACGLIPDSGTTLISASEKHLEILYESICNNWPRCKELQQELMRANDDQMEIFPAVTLQVLLQQCSDWMMGVDLNKEMPTLRFHVAGANGNQEELVLNPRSYVLLNSAQVEIPMVKKGIKGNKHRHQWKEVCVMAFNPIDYETEENGAVWIMGMPLFYDYTAHYDRGNGKESSVSMGFTSQDKEDCGQCESYNAIKRRSSFSLVANGVWKSTGLESLNRISRPPVTRNVTMLKSM